VPFVDRVHLHYVSRGWYVSEAPTVYLWRRPDGDRTITISTGTRSDLASSPRWAWWLIPPTGAYEDAAFVHDDGCRELHRAWEQRRPPAMTSREVDALFLDILEEADRYACQVGDPEGRIPAWKRRLLWWGVRLGALTSGARRAGWWRDAPAVAAITVPVLAVLLAAWWAAAELFDLLFWT
jgi:hypothetical protein